MIRLDTAKIERKKRKRRAIVLADVNYRRGDVDAGVWCSECKHNDQWMGQRFVCIQPAVLKINADGCAVAANGTCDNAILYNSGGI